VGNVEKIKCGENNHEQKKIYIYIKIYYIIILKKTNKNINLVSHKTSCPEYVPPTTMVAWNLLNWAVMTGD
jgi:hypothetical protein